MRSVFFINLPPPLFRLLPDDILRTKKKVKLQTQTNVPIFINRATQTARPPQHLRKKPTTTKPTAPALCLHGAKSTEFLAQASAKNSTKSASLQHLPPSSQLANHQQHLGPHNHDHWLCQKCCPGPECRRSFGKRRKKNKRSPSNRNNETQPPKPK